MLMKHLFPVLFFAGLLAACTAGKEEEASRDVVRFEVENARQKSFFDYFERVDLIPLETTDSSVVADYPQRIELYRDTLLLLYPGSGSGKGIFRFDAKDGHFIDRFYQVGEGPDDHLMISDCHINPYTGMLTVYEPTIGRLSVYDWASRTRVASADLRSKWGSVFGVNYFFPLSADKYVFFSGYVPKGTENRGQLFFYDFSTDSLYRQKLDIPEIVLQTSYISTSHPFSRVDDDVLLALPYLYTIYRYDGEYFVPEKRFDFGKYGCIEDYYLAPTDTRTSSQQIDYLFDSDDKYINIASVPMYTVGRMMFAGRHDKRYPLLVFDRKTQEACVVDGLQEGVYVFPDVGQEQGRAYRLCGVSEVGKYVNEKVLDEKNRAILERLEEDSNPILLRYILKE